MSSINNIAASQSSVPVTNAKPTAQQTSATSQQLTSTSSSVTISSAGAASLNNDQKIAQIQEGRYQSLAYAKSDPAWGADLAYALSHDKSMNAGNVGGLLKLTSLTDMNAPIAYASGEPVTAASQAYYTQHAASYQKQVLELYNTGQAKGATPAQIVSDIYDLQARQPDAFRAMNQWPPASGPSSIQDATNTPGTTPQYLNAGGQAVNASSPSYSNYDKLIAQNAARKREQILSNAFDSLISSLGSDPASNKPHATTNEKGASNAVSTQLPADPFNIKTSANTSGTAPQNLDSAKQGVNS